jgi:N-acetylneuraminate synthase
VSAPVLIIAEAGVNHNGDMALARRLIDAAADAGADFVKFQTFRASSLTARTAPKAEYQKQLTGIAESQFEMIRKLELTEEHHHELREHCRLRGIRFLSTPFDAESLRMLVEKFDVPYIKMPSGELTNAPLLLEAARTSRPVILSTGMSTLEEVREALGVLAFGYLPAATGPSVAAFAEAGRSAQGQALLREHVTLLHCTTEYPCPFGDVNLAALKTMRDAFGLPVGYSDHTPGISIPVAAVALGATLIEKHFTLDRGLPGPDHQASLEPEELKAMVRAIREVEPSLGDGVKQPAPSERKNIAIARKSLVAARAISRGEVFTLENLTAKRPAHGISPMRMWEWLGREAERDFAEDELIG